MVKKLSPWCKKAKISVILKDINITTMANELGYQRPYVSSVLNGGVVCSPARKKISDYLNISDSEDDLKDYIQSLSLEFGE